MENCSGLLPVRPIDGESPSKKLRSSNQIGSALGVGVSLEDQSSIAPVGSMTAQKEGASPTSLFSGAATGVVATVVPEGSRPAPDQGTRPRAETPLSPQAKTGTPKKSTTDTNSLV